MAQHLPLPWYHRQDWSALHDMFVERETTPSDYDIWKQRALRAERRYRKKGYAVVRVVVTPEDLRRWCSQAGYPVTLNARHEFARVKMSDSAAHAV